MNSNSPLELFTAGYITALLWSSSVTGPDGEDMNADEFELSAAGADLCRADCLAFYQRHGADVDAAAQVYGYDQAGHDFALTRNRHGAGYWDGDLPHELGERLTRAAEHTGQCNAYLGDDGLIYFWG